MRPSVIQEVSDTQDETTEKLPDPSNILIKTTFKGLKGGKHAKQ